MEAGREKLGKIREFVQKVQHLNKKSLGKRKEEKKGKEIMKGIIQENFSEMKNLRFQIERSH